MAGPVPILLAGGVLLFFAPPQKRGRRRGRKVSEVGQPCDSNSTARSGMICKDGVLYPLILDESDLEEDAAVGPESFEVREIDLSEKEDEETESEDAESSKIEAEDSTLKCNEFLQAIHVNVTDDDELPINKIAVDQTVIPIMKSVLHSILEENPEADEDATAPAMTAAALKALVPFCDWKYDEDLYEFTFDGNRVTSSVGRDIIYGLLQLSDRIIEESGQGAQD